MIVYMHKEVCRRAALMHAALRFVSFENLPHITRSTTIFFVFFMCMFGNLPFYIFVLLIKHPSVLDR